MSPLLLSGEGMTAETMAFVFATESRSVYELLTMQGDLRFPEDFPRDWTENILFIICGGSTAALAADSSALGESGGPYLDMHGAPRAYVRWGDRCHGEVYIKELLAAVFTTWACYDNLMEMESSLLKPTHSLDSGLQEKRKPAASKQLSTKILSNKSGANLYALQDRFSTILTGRDLSESFLWCSKYIYMSIDIY